MLKIIPIVFSTFASHLVQWLNLHLLSVHLLFPMLLLVRHSTQPRISYIWRLVVAIQHLTRDVVFQYPTIVGFAALGA